MKYVSWLQCKLTDIVADVGGGISEDPVDELTDHLLVHNVVDLRETK